MRLNTERSFKIVIMDFGKIELKPIGRGDVFSTVFDM